MTLKSDKEPWGDYTERELYDMITDVYAYVFEVVFRVSCTNDEHSYLFLDLDPSKSMNIELSAREHIKTLQRHIKANIVADVGGRVSVTLAHSLSCSRCLVALYRKSRWHHPVHILYEGKEAETHCCGESL